MLLTWITQFTVLDYPAYCHFLAYCVVKGNNSIGCGFFKVIVTMLCMYICMCIYIYIHRSTCESAIMRLLLYESGFLTPSIDVSQTLLPVLQIAHRISSKLYVCIAAPVDLLLRYSVVVMGVASLLLATARPL